MGRMWHSRVVCGLAEHSSVGRREAVSPERVCEDRAAGSGPAATGEVRTESRWGCREASRGRAQLGGGRGTGGCSQRLDGRPYCRGKQGLLQAAASLSPSSWEGGAVGADVGRVIYLVELNFAVKKEGKSTK